MNEAIERLTRKAKVDNVGWHSLRHTFCIPLAMLNTPPSAIQKLAGHASLATTMRYLHVVPGATDAAIAALDAAWATGDRFSQPRDPAPKRKPPINRRLFAARPSW